jgi:1-acyl-sn-glycerol-3-phosphate acyltransferase
MAPFGYALFALVALLPTRAPWRRARRMQAGVRLGLRLLHWWMRVTRLVHFRPAQLRSQWSMGPCVVVANHPTLTDSTALLSSIPDLCTPVRSDLFNRPWLRPLLGACGHFDAGSSNPLGSAQFLENAAERLQEGLAVLVFPEGTRSPRAGLGHFGRSAFEAACRANVPIVALLIREEPQFLARGQGLLGHPPAVPRKHVQIWEVINPADFSEDSRKMRDYLESKYRSALTESRPPLVLGAPGPTAPIRPGFPQRVQK